MLEPTAAVRNALAAVSGAGLSFGSSRDYESMSDEELDAVVEMGKRRLQLLGRIGDVGGFGLGLTATLGVARMLR